MRLLVDENLSPRVAELLRDAGFAAAHVLDRGLSGAPDTSVSALAVSEGRSVVSADSDFATLLAMSRGTAPSLVLLRSGDLLTAQEQAALLIANLPPLASDLEQGVVISLSTTHARVRRLPLG